MPTLTPFGEVALQDAVSIERWTDAHARKHQQLTVENIYVQQFYHRFGYHIMVRSSVGGILAGPIDGDWMLRHAARHISLVTAAQKLPQQPFKLPPLSSADTKVLLLPAVWRTEGELQDWHALHNRLHFLIDQVRQIASVQAKPNANAGIGPPALPGKPTNILPHFSGPIP